jgi:hypothetical protein
MISPLRAFLALAGVAVAGCWLFAAPPSSRPAGDAQPSATSGGKTPPAAQPEPADNSYCYVCHTIFDGEKLTAVHQRVSVGCERCHGTSVKHSGDEDGLTPPEKMYAKSQVNSFCTTCHEKSKLLKREDHQEFFKEMQPGETCSDCHAAKHHLKVRTRIWDKTTGKLLKDDGVRMMQKDSPATEGAASKAK